MKKWFLQVTDLNQFQTVLDYFKVKLGYDNISTRHYETFQPYMAINYEESNRDWNYSSDRSKFDGFPEITWEQFQELGDGSN